MSRTRAPRAHPTFYEKGLELTGAAHRAGVDVLVGTDYVVAGKVADLVLLRADPLADIRNTQRIQAVVFDGNLYAREALDGLQTLVRRRARRWAVGCKILWRFVRSPARY